MFPTNDPVIIITMGDPAGIGPEIISGALKDVALSAGVSFVVIGDRTVFEKVSEGLEVEQVSPDQASVHDLSGGGIFFIDPGAELEGHCFGRPTEQGSRKALAAIDLAVELMKVFFGKRACALVTAPVSKGMIAEISSGFIGHTEYLQEAFSVDRVTMVMLGNSLRVVPVTRHIPLRDVARVLSKELVTGTVRQVVEYRRMITGKEKPRIVVAALNPHCGEGGGAGTEEIDIIEPSVSEVKKEYPDITGPVAADTVFYKAFKGDFDVVIAMYHDQGLTRFKMIEFDEGVNMTIGLGHVRTSPDHGTAFDIAGKGLADHRSMSAAIRMGRRAIGA